LVNHFVELQDRARARIVDQRVKSGMQLRFQFAALSVLAMAMAVPGSGQG
jgi:hypothetical protein